jgi:methyltransferase
MIFILFISFIVLLRISELILSKRNEKWLLQNGAVEYGSKHYPFIVMLHVAFFISLIIEYYIRHIVSYSLFFLIFYFFLLLFKAWVILSLGKFWNTKIYRIKDYPLINKGPYKYFKHPNYFVVIIEIAVIPLAFHLYYTAIIFTILNAIMLSVRIKEENKALQNING